MMTATAKHYDTIIHKKWRQFIIIYVHQVLKSELSVNIFVQFFEGVAQYLRKKVSELKFSSEIKIDCYRNREKN